MGALLKVQNDAKGDDNAPAFSDPSWMTMTAGQTKNLRNPLIKNKNKKKETDDGFVQSKDNSDILNKLEKEFMSLNKMAMKFMET